MNAGKDDVVIFTGSGATAGLHKIAWGLKINQPRVAEETVFPFFFSHAMCSLSCGNKKL